MLSIDRRAQQNAETEGPPLDAKLLDWLDARIPEKSARKGETEADLRFAGGMRETVRMLQRDGADAAP